MSGAPDAARERRIAEVIAAVARQAMADWGAGRIALLDDGSPEVELAYRWLSVSLPEDALLRVDPGPSALELVLQTAGAAPSMEGARMEARRLFARLVPGALPALAANKTALLLGGPLPPEPLLPMGDLYASELQGLGHGWSLPEEVRELVEHAEGLERLDGALRAWFDGRDPTALDRLPAGVRRDVRAALDRGRASRLASRIVPKLGSRTLGVDLFE